jgi:glycosidase
MNIPIRRAFVVILLLISCLSVAQVRIVQVLPPPDWLADAVIYQLQIRNFTPEGTFKAATVKLEEVKSLGVNTVYLLPFHPTGLEKRKGSLGSPYSVRDYLAVDPAQGSLEDFRAFVVRAHALGLRVITDLVFNHTAWDNVLVQAHPNWYARDANGKMRSPLPDWSDVAQLEVKSLEVQQYLAGVGIFWLEQGVDGFRADVSRFLPVSFWQYFRKAVKSFKPDALLLAESPDIEWHDRAFDVSYDWQGLPLVIQTMNGLRAANDFFGYQAQVGVPKLRYIENHDQDRIASKFRQPLQRRVLAALLLLQPGVPLIYAGQESGLEHRPSIFDRDPLDWSKGDPSLQEWYTKLLSVRASLEPLRRGEFWFIAGQSSRVMAFIRISRGQQVNVLLNLSENPQKVNLPVQAWKDAVSGREFPGGEMMLEAGAVLILQTR